MVWIRLGIKEIFKNRGFSLFFILNLSLGLAGYIALGSFGSSLNRHFDGNLKEILTADLVLSAASELTPEELELADSIVGKDVSRARLVSFYTMVKTPEDARLVQVMAIDENYPLYGEFVFEGVNNKVDLAGNPELVMARETARTLGIEKNLDTPVELGDKSFFIRDFLKDDPNNALTALELAPKIYMGVDQLEGTGLLGFGSRIRYLYYFSFSSKVDVSGITARLDRAFYQQSFGNPKISVFDTRDVNQRIARLIGYFTGYMGLVSVVALFLAGISGAYLFRGYLNLKYQEIAILQTLGARQGHIFIYILFQLFVLGAVASIVAAFLALLLIPMFPLIFRGVIPGDLGLSLDFSTLAVAMVMGVGGSLVFCLPVFVKIFGVKPIALFKKSQGQNQKQSQNRKKTRSVLLQGLAFVPLILGFFLASIVASGSAMRAIVFVAGFGLVLVLVGAMGWAVFSGCRFLSVTRFIPGKIAFRNLYRNKWSSLSCFVTIAMGCFLISTVPQIQKGLQTEIMRPEGLKIPVFFLVDIQEEQQSELVDFMDEHRGRLTNLSPMVRGRIVTVNGDPFYGRKDDKGEQRREVSGLRGSGRGRRLEFNFSHRKELDVSETIVQGRALAQTDWSFDAGIPFEISVEKNFADQHGLQMDDIIEFDIQGITLEGRVVNLRKVRWNSFQPNFFLLFQKGVLTHAPKTYLAAIAQVAPEQRQELKSSIVTAFPNVSVIDVSQMAATLLGITDKLSLSIGFMAWIAIVTGLVSIFSIARHEAWTNRQQINLLKVIGGDFRLIQKITLTEFGFMGFTAALFAITLSFGFSRLVSGYFFDSLWAFDLLGAATILCLTTLISMATAFAATFKVMKMKPVSLFYR